MHLQTFKFYHFYKRMYFILILLDGNAKTKIDGFNKMEYQKIKIINLTD